MGFPSLASEFPNDNAEISGGAIWIGKSLTGPATLELAPYEPVRTEPFVLFFDDDEAYVDGPVELELSGGGVCIAVQTPEFVEDIVAPVSESEQLAATETETETATETATETETETEPLSAPRVAPAFAHFESALTSALMSQGASRSAALLPRLLRLESLSPDAFSKEVLLTLQSRGYLDSHARYSAKFRDLCGAWSAVLSGASQDFAACGTTTLDRFGADLLAALLAVPATRSDELRRELRKAGIAAFGVLEAA
ncbi:MAG TPA: hypothetical protein VHP33_09905 [Polyangiaceae bacterium]|nr:hypothetical protein [Polyangiaceae bacterium]